MTRLEALTELRDKVRAGVFPADMCARDLGLNGVNDINQIYEAYNGSLDAAKALHDAVLPGFDALIGILNPSWVQIFEPVDDEWEEVSSAEADNAARAWLIAILRSLIAQEVAS